LEQTVLRITDLPATSPHPHVFASCTSHAIQITEMRRNTNLGTAEKNGAAHVSEQSNRAHRSFRNPRTPAMESDMNPRFATRPQPLLSQEREATYQPTSKSIRSFSNPPRTSSSTSTPCPASCGSSASKKPRMCVEARYGTWRESTRRTD
jgi:hypothetical protein